MWEALSTQPGFTTTVLRLHKRSLAAGYWSWESDMAVCGATRLYGGPRLPIPGNQAHS